LPSFPWWSRSQAVTAISHERALFRYADCDLDGEELLVMREAGIMAVLVE
jgi:hypothetical protein